MRLSTSTNIYFNRPDGTKAGIQDSMRRCREAGYSVMDLNFHDCTTFGLPFVGEGWRAWLEEVAGLCIELGVQYSQAHAPFYNFCMPQTSERAKEIDRLVLRAIDCCAALGIPWLVIHAGTAFEAASPVRESRRLNREYFGPVLEYAAKKGVGIAFENLWECNIAPLRRYTATPEELVELADSFGSAGVGVCWDTDHAHLMRQNQPEALRLIGKRLVATHICDCIDTVADHMLPYTGGICWEPIMRALHDIAYKGDLTYEIHRYTSTMPDALVPAALRYSVQVGEYLLDLAEKPGSEHEPI